MPPEFTLISGNLNKSVGFLGIGGSSTNSIIIRVSPSIGESSYLIYAFSGSSGGSVYNISQNITTTIEPPTVINPPASTTSSSGGGGSPVTASSGGGYVEKLLQTQEMYELVRGFDNNFTLTVENPFDGNLKDVKVDIKGFLSQYLKVEPDVIDDIKENKSSNFTIAILAPKYFARGTYNLNFTITGLIEKSGVLNNQTWTSTRKMKESRLVTLMIHEVSRASAIEYLNESYSLISLMAENNFNVDPLKALYEQAQKSFKDFNYENVKVLYDSILLAK